MMMLAGGGARAASSRKAEAAKKAVMQADLDFCAATKERRLDGWMSFFAEDATGFPVGQKMIRGKDKLREFYGRMFADPNLVIDWKPVLAEAAASGDLGMTIGEAEFRTKDKEGKPVSRPGKYLTVWKKQKDGSWKVIADLGN